MHMRSHWDEPHLAVITGPMFSGKSDELIRRLRVASIGGHGVLIVKPASDTRTHTTVQSRGGGVMDAVVAESAAHLLKLVEQSHRVIGIDEAQFFDEGIVEVVRELLRAGKRVYVAGLALDYAEKPFVHMASLMAMATECHVLMAVCMQCKNPNASRTMRLVESTERHLVGDGEAYEPRCLGCYHCPS